MKEGWECHAKGDPLKQAHVWLKCAYSQGPGYCCYCHHYPSCHYYSQLPLDMTTITTISTTDAAAAAASDTATAAATTITTTATATATATTTTTTTTTAIATATATATTTATPENIQLGR